MGTVILRLNLKEPIMAGFNYIGCHKELSTKLAKLFKD
jgi:hypothetical protein